ncbi:MAG: hypothetical protein A2289_03310 [Deltaproteobacteria bacterium RIFOXYA12_FULL_58_15]|nr:MAG: hypothetical protein A2289_03310 [Deltaproteobacteria bacterium RIFOXYA12_FULL_58_15]OGR15309.1 MAG: hypothetical protein A2341_09850 [Deltaproteobacteria bacterium RIFOXYB12_FULL_58_9]
MTLPSSVSSVSFETILLLLFACAPACRGTISEGREGSEPELCADGLVSQACDCGGDLVDDGYCCLGKSQSYACDVGACEEGAISGECLCGGALVSGGSCCAGEHKPHACVVPACPSGDVRFDCLCEDEVVSTGYCCREVHQEDSCSFSVYYLSPEGSDESGDGSNDSPWFTLQKAWSVVSAGDTIYLRGGTYAFSARQNLSGKSGASDTPIRVFAYPGENPILTKAAPFSSTWPYTLLYLQGNYTHWKGIEITGVTQESEHVWTGMTLENSNHNILEQMNSHHNGHGMVIKNNSSHNLVLNSDFHHNYDPLTPIPYDNGDGLNVAYLDDNAVNNIRGCRFYYNSDDGLDLWENNGHVTIENSWAFRNGYREDMTTAGGNGEGFKLGRTTTADGSLVLRVVRNNLSFHNRRDGISQNDANCKMSLYNNTVYANGYRGMEFFTHANENVIRNNIAFANANAGYSGDLGNSTIDHNSYDPAWQPDGPVITEADFMSLDASGVADPRQGDGSLPDIDFLRLANDSNMIDVGIDVGIPFFGGAPDLGAYEYNP